MVRVLASAVLLLLASAASAAARAADTVAFTDFLRKAYGLHPQAIETRLGARYRALCEKLGVPGEDSANRAALYPLLFYHGLLTTREAVDCRKGGAFGTSYLWHWVTPNPRHKLRRLPDSTPLGRLPPPPGYGKYRSFADADRLPALYLGDLLPERPRYHLPGCGDIQTFGWCSEREMAFGALLAALALPGPGIRTKIRQEGIHVWTEVLVTLRGPGGRARRGVVALDNTFDTAGAWSLEGAEAAWARDFGDGAQVAWYNQVASSPAEIAKVRALRIGPEGARRRMLEIRDWLGLGR